MPNLLVAPANDEIDTNGVGEGSKIEEGRGYYENGAYTALPARASTIMVDGLEDHIQEEDVEDIDPQEAYYASLMDRFQALRSVLHSPLPKSARIAPKYLISGNMVPAAAKAYSLHGATHKQWRYELTHTEPPAQVLACMTQEGVIRGLFRLETMLSKSNLHASPSGKVLGAWCWGLLGRCKDLGEMSSEEVAMLRMVGKTALRLGQKLRMQQKMGQADIESIEEAQMEDVEEEELEGDVEPGQMAVDGDISAHVDPTCDAPIANGKALAADGTIDEKPILGIDAGNKKEDEEMEDGELDETEESAELLAQAKEALLAHVRSSPPPASTGDSHEADLEARTFATLDMIVTIVGEFYGQRDLLDARAVWT